ncbi:MAG: cell wall metabolism sensor histidine kinase WalK [Defluviitaleaceae bacterium]|nr:cell wall metabolism sensor histidine kinase WalK [Defluviitaleaceae bacterium]
MDKVRKVYSLRFRLFAIFLAVSFLPLGFFSMTVAVFIRDYYLSDREGELRRRAHVIEGAIRQGNFLTDSERAPLFAEEIGSIYAGDDFRVLAIDSRAIVVHDSNFIENGATFLSPEVLEALSGSTVSSIQDDGVTMYTAVPIFDSEYNVVNGALLLVSSIVDIYELLGSIQQMLMLLLLATAIIILVVVFFISEIILSPLKKIMRVVTLMSEGHLNQRIGLSGRDEFAQLATAFNRMNDELEQVEKTREEFVSNVSHELKTPLSAMKVLSESLLLQDGVAEEIYKDFLKDISSEIDRMDMIVNDLLTLVKFDQRDMPLMLTQIDLNQLTEDILRRLYPLAEVKNIELLHEDVRKVAIAGDEMKLGLALSNLVENGIKYTSEGGNVKVTVDADHQNTFITISDTGIGIAEDELGKIFTRFYRVDKTRDRDTGGTGLGLAISYSAVRLHNGSIRVSSKEGAGSTFVVRIPLQLNV